MTATSTLKGLHRVRWVSGAEPEMQCARCFEFLPITVEYWVPSRGLRRCRACLVELTRLRIRAAMARRRADPNFLAEERARKRIEYHANIEDRRTYHREWNRRRRSTLARAIAAGVA